VSNGAAALQAQGDGSVEVRQTRGPEFRGTFA